MHSTIRHKDSTIRILTDGSCLITIRDNLVRCHNLPTAKFFVDKEISMKNRNKHVDIYRAIGASVLGFEFKDAIVLIGSSDVVSEKQYREICINTQSVLKGCSSGVLTLDEVQDELQNFEIIDDMPGDSLSMEEI